MCKCVYMYVCVCVCVLVTDVHPLISSQVTGMEVGMSYRFNIINCEKQGSQFNSGELHKTDIEIDKWGQQLDSSPLYHFVFFTDYSTYFEIIIM